MDFALISGLLRLRLIVLDEVSRLGIAFGLYSSMIGDSCKVVCCVPVLGES